MAWWQVTHDSSEGSGLLPFPEKINDAALYLRLPNRRIGESIAVALSVHTQTVQMHTGTFLYTNHVLYLCQMQNMLLISTQVTTSHTFGPKSHLDILC